MTRKDYEKIAGAIQLLPRDMISRVEVAEAFVPVLLEDNENFDITRFLEACGVTIH